jgi:DNA-binding XRE family transcriptional regulator
MGRDGKTHQITPFAKGLTQIELAAASHLAPTAISFSEAGQVNPKVTTTQANSVSAKLQRSPPTLGIDLEHSTTLSYQRVREIDFPQCIR